MGLCAFHVAVPAAVRQSPVEGGLLARWHARKGGMDGWRDGWMEGGREGGREGRREGKGMRRTNLVQPGGGERVLVQVTAAVVVEGCSRNPPCM